MVLLDNDGKNDDDGAIIEQAIRGKGMHDEYDHLRESADADSQYLEWLSRRADVERHNVTDVTADRLAKRAQYLATHPICPSCARRDSHSKYCERGERA